MAAEPSHALHHQNPDSPSEWNPNVDELAFKFACRAGSRPISCCSGWRPSSGSASAPSTWRDAVNQSRSESACSALVGPRLRLASVLDYLRHGETDLQPLVREFESQSGADYCAVAVQDGRLSGPFEPELVGQAGGRARRHDRAMGRHAARRVRRRAAAS